DQLRIGVLTPSFADVYAVDVLASRNGIATSYVGEMTYRFDRKTKHDTTVRGASQERRAIEAAVARLDQSRHRHRAVARVEAVERRQRARRIDLEDRAVIRRAASRCRAVEAAVARLDQGRQRTVAVALVEAMEGR